MPSSIFGFEKLNPTRAIVLLLAALSAYFCTLEAVTRVLFTHASGIQRRIQAGHAIAIELRPTTPDGAETVLLVGNSLVIAGVDSNRLRQEMAPEYHVEMFPIENTTYLDWYFGTRRLFAEGARPGVFILCLTPRELIGHWTDGEYFAHYMMQFHDIFLVKKEAQLDMTMTSNYFFARLSAWLGSRSEIRNWLLEEMFPSVETLTSYLPAKPGPMPPTDVVVREGLPRLQAMQQLCKNHGTRFVFLMPPSLEPDNSAEVILAAAPQAGITALLPYRTRELPVADFQDGFHLNPHGSALFTAKLGSLLARAISQN